MPTMRKATIRNLDTGDNIVCQFNPTDLTLTKSGNWQSGSESQSNSGDQKFANNNPVSLKVKLLFDVYSGFDANGQPNGSSSKNVTDYTKKLWALMVPNQEKHAKTHNQRPSRVQFMWGGFILPYEFFIENLSEQLTLFTMDGIPVRSMLDISLKEINSGDKKGDTVSTNSAGQVNVATYGTKNSAPISVVSTHVTQNNDTLSKIAYERLGDARLWPKIVEANAKNALGSARNKLGSNLRDLPSGIALKIPE